MRQQHLLPTEAGLQAWVLQQDWLILDLAERVRSRVDLPLTAADQIITKALAPGGTFRRAVFVKALQAAGYTEGSTEVPVHRTPNLQAVARGNSVLADSSSKPGHEMDEGRHDTSTAVSCPSAPTRVRHCCI